MVSERREMEILYKEKDFWDEELGIIGTSIELWNGNVLRWMRREVIIDRDPRKTDDDVLYVYKKYVHSEAKRRGWRYDPELGKYVYKSVTPEEREMVYNELERQAESNMTRGRMRKTFIKDVLAYWQVNNANETGILLVQDMRAGKYRKYCWEGIPESEYHKLFDHDAKATLKNLITIFGENTRGNEKAWLELSLNLRDA